MKKVDLEKNPTTELDINNLLCFPRSEAHAREWDDLLLPIKRTVFDLLMRLDGAEQIEDGAEVANCFLIYGSRGMGKTGLKNRAQAVACCKSKK